jgi:hypothetical protein
MNNPILSIDAIRDLANLIANELESRRSNNQPAETQNPKPEQRLYGNKAAACYLGCTPQTIISLKKQGAITYYRTGSRCYFIASELDESLKVTARRFGELRGRRKDAK